MPTRDMTALRYSRETGHLCSRELDHRFCPRRKFYDCREQDPRRAGAILVLIKDLYRIEERAKEVWKVLAAVKTEFNAKPGQAVRLTVYDSEAKFLEVARLKHEGTLNEEGVAVVSLLGLEPGEYSFAAYLDQNVENMRQGIEDGFTQPKEILPLIMPSFEAQATARAEDHPLYGPFESFPATIGAKEQAALKKKGAAVLSGEVIPAYRRVLAFMRDEYLPAARDTVGADAWPDGADYYGALVRYFTTLDDATPEAIHALGLKEVARIRAEMDKVMKEAGFKGSFAEFIEFLRTDEQFYPKTAQQLLEYAAWISKDIDGRLPAYFGKLPRQPYSVEPVPEAIAENYTTGRYVSAPPGGTRGGQYWVNTSSLDKRPLFEIPALTLHEAVPGHHLQSALAYEIEGAPAFREQFYPHAFGEGWGLYSEKLGVEMGIYQTPYDHAGRLSYELWRACRLVIDTGLHSKGWTRQQALDYLAANTALSMKNVQTEVDRYIAWPGQALAYKMGELKLWELRARAEKALGDKFDIREFHDAVLTEGGLPLDMLNARIDSYIALKKVE